MLIRTLLSRFCLMLLFCVVCCAPVFTAAARPDHPGSAEEAVTVAVYNQSNVPARELAQAEATATHIFRQAGLQVQWVDCGPAAQQREEPPEERIEERLQEQVTPGGAPPFEQGSQKPPKEGASCSLAAYPDHLRLRILPRPRILSSATGPASALAVNEATFGLSYFTSDKIGCYTEVFFSQILKLHDNYHQNTATILGHVMAHEVGHLLGINSHSATGIMRAHWDPDELVLASQGRLLFTPKQSEVMRRTLLRSTKPDETVAAAH